MFSLCCLLGNNTCNVCEAAPLGKLQHMKLTQHTLGARQFIYQFHNFPELTHHLQENATNLRRQVIQSSLQMCLFGNRSVCANAWTRSCLLLQCNTFPGSQLLQAQARPQPHSAVPMGLVAPELPLARTGQDHSLRELRGMASAARGTACLAGQRDTAPAPQELDWNPTGHQFWASQGTDRCPAAGHHTGNWAHLHGIVATWVETGVSTNPVLGGRGQAHLSPVQFSITAQKVFISCWQHVQPMRLPVSELSIMGLTYEERLNELNMQSLAKRPGWGWGEGEMMW